MWYQSCSFRRIDAWSVRTDVVLVSMARFPVLMYHRLESATCPVVAPEERRDKVFAEIRRPVFSLLESGPLSESCTFIAYESVRELAKEANLEYLSDRVLERYEEESEELDRRAERRVSRTCDDW